MPNVGLNQNTLSGVSELPGGNTWAAGYYLDANWVDQTLIEHWNGSTWSVIPSPSPGAQGNILYGIAALAASDVWAVGLQLDANVSILALGRCRAGPWCFKIDGDFVPT